MVLSNLFESLEIHKSFKLVQHFVPIHIEFLAVSYSPETLQAFLQHCKVSVAGTLLLFVVQQINFFFDF